MSTLRAVTAASAVFACVLQCVAVSCSVLQYDECVAVCCSVLQRVAMCCSMLQCVAVCCSVLQRIINYNLTHLAYLLGKNIPK